MKHDGTVWNMPRRFSVLLVGRDGGLVPASCPGRQQEQGGAVPGTGEPHTTPAEGMCSGAQDAPSALHVERFCPVGLTGAPDAGSV